MQGIRPESVPPVQKVYPPFVTQVQACYILRPFVLITCASRQKIFSKKNIIQGRVAAWRDVPDFRRVRPRPNRCHVRRTFFV